MANNTVHAKGTSSRTAKAIKTSTEPMFSVDAVIDAYKTGHDDGCGLKTNILEIAKDLICKLKTGLDEINKFYAENLNEDICIASFFKLEHRHNISFLFAIKKEIYYDNNMRTKLYTNSGQSMLKYPFLDISFMSCNDRSNINEDGIIGDNFKELLTNAESTSL